MWISRLAAEKKKKELRENDRNTQSVLKLENLPVGLWIQILQHNQEKITIIWSGLQLEGSSPMLLSIIYQAETNYDDTILDFISFQSAFKWILPSRSYEVCFLPITNWTWTQKYWQFPCFFSFLPCGKPNRKSILISNNNLHPQPCTRAVQDICVKN